jgi:hypothetical protein
MGTKVVDISKLSPHLFWDVDIKSVSFEKHSHFIVQRIMNYGKIGDWNHIYKVLGIDKITEIAVEIRDLDEKALSFLVLLSGKKKEDFVCYTYKRSIPPHWNF